MLINGETGNIEDKIARAPKQGGETTPHFLFDRFHKPADEKRMVVVLAPDSYQSWLEAPPERSMGFMRQMSAELLVAVSPISMPSMFDKGPLSLAGQTDSIQKLG